MELKPLNQTINLKNPFRSLAYKKTFKVKLYF